MKLKEFIWWLAVSCVTATISTFLEFYVGAPSWIWIPCVLAGACVTWIGVERKWI